MNLAVGGGQVASLHMLNKRGSIATLVVPAGEQLPPRQARTANSYTSPRISAMETWRTGSSTTPPSITCPLFRSSHQYRNVSGSGVGCGPG